MSDNPPTRKTPNKYGRLEQFQSCCVPHWWSRHKWLKRHAPMFVISPLQERPAYYQAILTEMLEEPVKRRHGRRIHRGVKRKMGRYPLRKRGTGHLPTLDVATALVLLK